MAKVYQLFGHSEPKEIKSPSSKVVSNTMVGLEVELEGFYQHLESHPQGWNVIPDGSLRDGGLEFVFRGPAGGRTIITRLNSFRRSIEALDFEPKVSERTSIHVHIDVRDMEWHQLWSMLALYAIVEPFLFSVCGSHRADNIYCLGWYKGESQIRAIRKLRDERGHVRVSRTRDFPKYSAVNMGSIAQFGSLEFRGHEGTLDIDRILYWTNLLLSLKEYVMTSESDPEDYPRMMSALGATAFLREVFGDLVPEEVGTKTQDLLYAGAWISEDILFQDKMEYIQEDILDSHSGGEMREQFAKHHAPRRSAEPEVCMDDTDNLRVVLAQNVLGHIRGRFDVELDERGSVPYSVAEDILRHFNGELYRVTPTMVRRLGQVISA